MSESIDISKTTAPKSDQTNADDLIYGPRTITVTRVSLVAEDQPVHINFEGDEGRPFKPCKSMRRVLSRVWGSNGSEFVGRSMTLYLDEKVVYGNTAVGGIRISHMSGIDAPVTMALTTKRGVKKAYTVQPLAVQQERKSSLSAVLALINSATGKEGLAKVKELAGNLSEKDRAEAAEAYKARVAEIKAASESLASQA